jgi:DNA-binding LytR/AlgR family response regulator
VKYAVKFLIVDDDPQARSASMQLRGHHDDGVAATRAADRKSAAPPRARASRTSRASRISHASRPAEAISAFPTRSVKLLIGEREHRFYPLNAETIDYIESDGNYVTLWTRNSKYISRDTIKRLCVELQCLGFVQIQRSLLVNIRAVLHVEPAGRGAFAFTLSSGACLQSSTSYREAILQVLPMRRFSGRRSPP